MAYKLLLLLEVLAVLVDVFSAPAALDSHHITPQITVGGLAVVGRMASLTCTVTLPSAHSTHGPPFIKWTRKFDPKAVGIPATEKTFKTDSGTLAHNSTITLKVTKRLNREVRICTVRFHAVVASAEREVHVINPPDTPVISGPTIVSSGKLITWRCDVTGASGRPPEVRWEFGNGTRIRTGLTTHPVSVHRDPDSSVYRTPHAALVLHDAAVSLTLRIPSTGPESLNLSCVAFSHLTRTETFTNITVVVHDPPDVAGDTRYTTMPGQEVVLNCTVSFMHNVISVTWYKDGERLVHEPERFSGGDVETPSLKIKSAQEDDTGEYICRVTSRYGDTNSSQILLIVGKDPVTVEGPKAFRTDTSQNLTLTCRSPATIPSPLYSWSSEPDLCGTSGTYTSHNVCSFSPSAKHDGVEVTCSVKNLTSDENDPDYPTNDTFTLDLLYPPPGLPEITGYTSGVVLTKGDVLTCTVRGGKPVVAELDFSCPEHDLLDKEDRVTGATVTSQLVIPEKVYATHAAMVTCSCTYFWNLDPTVVRCVNISFSLDPTVLQVRPSAYKLERAYHGLAAILMSAVVVAVVVSLIVFFSG